MDGRLFLYLDAAVMEFKTICVDFIQIEGKTATEQAALLEVRE
jgi:hypothetical protein